MPEVNKKNFATIVLICHDDINFEVKSEASEKLSGKEFHFVHVAFEWLVKIIFLDASKVKLWNTTPNSAESGVKKNWRNVIKMVIQLIIKEL